MREVQQVRLSLLAIFLLLILAWPAGARAQSTSSSPIIDSRLGLPQVLDKLVQKNTERADALQKYQGRRFYSLDYKGFPASFHAEMVVDMNV